MRGRAAFHLSTRLGALRRQAACGSDLTIAGEATRRDTRTPLSSLPNQSSSHDSGSARKTASTSKCSIITFT